MGKEGEGLGGPQIKFVQEPPKYCLTPVDDRRDSGIMVVYVTGLQ